MSAGAILSAGLTVTAMSAGAILSARLTVTATIPRVITPSVGIVVVMPRVVMVRISVLVSPAGVIIARMPAVVRRAVWTDRTVIAVRTRVPVRMRTAMPDVVPRAPRNPARMPSRIEEERLVPTRVMRPEIGRNMVVIKSPVEPDKEVRVSRCPVRIVPRRTVKPRVIFRQGGERPDPDAEPRAIFPDVGPEEIPAWNRRRGPIVIIVRDIDIIGVRHVVGEVFFYLRRIQCRGQVRLGNLAASVLRHDILRNGL